MKKLLTIAFTCALAFASGCTSKEDAEINFVFKDGTKEGVAAKIGDKEITFDQLRVASEGMQDQAEDKIFDAKFNRVRAVVLDHFIKLDPRSKKVANDEFLEKFVIPKKINIKKVEVIKFAKDRGIPEEQANSEDIQEKIRYFLEMQKKQNAVEDWLVVKTKRVPVIAYLDIPAARKAVIREIARSFKFELSKNLAVKIGDKEFTSEEIFEPIKNELYEGQVEVYNVQLNSLKSLLVDHFVGLNNKDKGVTVEEYLDKKVFGEIKVSDDEVNAFIKERSIPENAVEQLRPRIEQFLSNTIRQQKLTSWLADQTKKTPVEVYFKEPVRPVFDVQVGDSVFYGDKDAKNVIVEFTDFECPFCARGSTVMHDLKAKMGNNVKVVFKHFPLPFHPNAKLAHQVAACMSLQSPELFWKGYEEFFGNQAELVNAQETAKKLGADADKLAACIKNGDYEKIMAADQAQAEKLGINSTPTFFVNGKMVSGAQDLQVFLDLMEK